MNWLELFNGFDDCVLVSLVDVGLICGGTELATATSSVSSKFNFSRSGTGKLNLNAFSPIAVANDFLTKCAFAFETSVVAWVSMN